jgi:hypothetical protein
MGTCWPQGKRGLSLLYNEVFGLPFIPAFSSRHPENVRILPLIRDVDKLSTKNMLSWAYGGEDALGLPLGGG